MEHLREVAYHARQMALIAGMESDEVEVIFRAALLHDIGKFGVPDSILLKVEPLNKHEWRVLEQHPEFGARILRPLGFMRAEAALIKAHHERYDGLGYPEGVKGDEIPLGAGIISVADAYSFMTTRHPFREAKTHDEAVAEIERLSGRQFHPKAVEAFMSYVRNTERINKSEFRSEKT
ncbi:MAG: HD domain-containing protein [Planctomycetota bacterium]|nr:HD domain-containing protein [Planctomycetota bacterium]